MDRKGILHVTGEPDTGKTLLALTAYHPKQTAYFFDDVKQPPIDDKAFGLFVDLVGKYGELKLLEYYKAVMAEIDAIPDGKYKCIIFDTWARIGKAVRYYAKANPLEFREGLTFSRNGAIKGMEEWGETHRVEAKVISALSRKADLVVLITHIKEQIKAGAKTGSYEPDCGKSFNTACNMRLWLRHNQKSGVPIALVLKRLTKVTITKAGIKPVNVLPRRIEPLVDEVSVWDAIERYWQNPVGNREPLPEEIPSPFELSILEGTLTDDQKEMWRAELKAKELQEQLDKEFLDAELQEAKAKVQAMAGQPLALVFKEITKEYPDFDLAQVRAMMEG